MGIDLLSILKEIKKSIVFQNSTFYLVCNARSELLIALLTLAENVERNIPFHLRPQISDQQLKSSPRFQSL